MKWYVIKTKPHQERRVEFCFKSLGLEVFAPVLKRVKSIRRVPHIVLAPLFPGYLFVRFDLTEHYRTVNYAAGVQRIVSFDEKPAEVDASIVDAIKARLQNGLIVVKPVKFEEGQKVQISEGPLFGLEAVFVQELSDQRRALLLLNALGLQARVVISATQVRLAHAL